MRFVNVNRQCFIARNVLTVLAAAFVACAHDARATSGNFKFTGCYIKSYIYYAPTYTDSLVTTFISDDSLAYTIFETGGFPSVKYFYTYKVKGDSISVRRYTDSLSNLTYYATYFLNTQGLCSSYISFLGSGISNSTGTLSYNSDGRNTNQIADYTTYLGNYMIPYDATGNRQYLIYKVSGIYNYRDSFAYNYDLTKPSKIAYGAPNAFLFGNPDKNLVTQIRRYSTPTDTLKYTTDYTYILDGSGFVTQKNSTTTYTGSGSVSSSVEKFGVLCR